MKNKKIILIPIFLVLLVLIAIGFFFRSNLRQIAAQQVFNQGEHYFDGGDYDLDKAKKMYEIALRIDPNNEGAHYEIGRIYFLGGNFDQAISEFDLELKLHPDMGRTYYMLGLTNGYAGNLDEAVSDFQKFLAWKPNSWAGYNDLTWIYLTKKDYQDAKETAEKGLQVEENVWLRSNLGTALLNLGDYQGAENEFNQALLLANNLTPQQWSATYPGNDPKVAESGVREIRAGIYLNLAICEKKTGNTDEAKKYYDSYSSFLPENDIRQMPFDLFMIIP